MVSTPYSFRSTVSFISNLDDTNPVTSAHKVAASEPMSSPLGQDPSASVVSESRILLFSTRMDFPPMMDQQTCMSSIAALYDRLDAQTAVVGSYRSLEEALQ